MRAVKVASFNDKIAALSFLFVDCLYIMSIALDEVYNLLFGSVTIRRSVRPQIGENWRDRNAICQCRLILFEFAAERVV